MLYIFVSPWFEGGKGLIKNHTKSVSKDKIYTRGKNSVNIKNVYLQNLDR